jgi:hypothetical protein
VLPRQLAPQHQAAQPIDFGVRRQAHHQAPAPAPLHDGARQRCVMMGYVCVNE